MTGLAGWFGGGAGGEPLAAMVAALNRFHEAPVQSVVTPFGAVAAAGPVQGAHAIRAGETLVGLWGEPRFGDAALARLAQEQGFAHALARGWAERKSGVLEALAGSFALAIFDGASGEAMLAVDRMGTRPLCYQESGTTLLFGSTLDAIGAHPLAQSRIDPQAIYDYVHFHVIPAPRTIYAGRRRLDPGQALLWRAGAARLHTYWKPTFVEDERLPFLELKERFVQLLRESVRTASAGGAVGTFLSGGTDSSTVAGMLGAVGAEPARTYSVGFAAEGYDEVEYARIAARHFGTRHREYYVTPDDVVAAIPKIAAIHDQPFGNASAVPTYYCARLAREDGVEALLGGDGGDELFGGNARYARQNLLALYERVPAALRRGLIEPALRIAPGVGLVGKAQRYVEYASTPMPARYDDYNLLERLGPANVFEDEFLAGVDRRLPARHIEEHYRISNAGSLINRMLALDFKYTLADNDLPKVRRSCELAGVEVRFPLLDDALVAFAAQLPPERKLRSTRLRPFFKDALADFLPRATIAKAKHGFGLPVGPWLRSHPPLRELMMDSLSALKSRRVIRAQFIDSLVSVHLAAHAGYYGNMIWILAMLEHWLAQRGARA